MPRFPKFTVTFDDGTVIEAQATSRDMVRLEKNNVNLDELGGATGSYVIAHAVLSRLVKTGKLTDEQAAAVPADPDDLMDLADLDVDDEDPEGNGSGQVPTPG